MKPGDQMSWSYTPRGGYGWVIPVNAEVVKVNAKTVRIRVKRIDGAMVERNVKPESLKQRGIRPLPLDGTDFHVFGEE